MRRITLLLISFLAIECSIAQGISFSYLIPKNGYLSAPVSPFSVRGIGIGTNVGIETGASLYNVPGLAMDELSFTSDKPLVGPHFAFLVPGDVFIKLPMNKVIIKLFGGGFGWWNINTRPNSGNIDRALRSYEGWDVLNGDWSVDDQLGFGWLTGMELQLELSDQLTFTTEAAYLKGGSKTTLSGTYSGGTSGSAIVTKELGDEGSILLEGVEISIGVIFNR
ncbi:hypothetical protein [Marinoscillum sp.]|uniref:hypothetical protein n=1 Tax=Marinoscillum sp. TaxID=2024838 RepID=UPI003BACB923